MDINPTQFAALPLRAQQRVNTLEENTEAALAVARAATDKIGDKRAASSFAETKQRRLVASPLAKSQGDYDAVATEIAQAKDAFDRAQENADHASAIWTTKGGNRHRVVDKYVPHALRNGGLEDAEAAVPPGTTFESATEQLQVALDDLAEVRRSTLPIAESQATARQIVTGRALPFQLSVNDQYKVNVRPPLVGAGGPDAFALLAYYFPDVVLADLDRQAEALVAGRLQLTRDERSDRLAAARAALLDAEMMVGELVWRRFAETGTGFDFPATLDPRAILGVVGCPPKAP